MKNVSLLCILTLQGKEKVCLYADECEKKYLNIQHVKALCYYSNKPYRETIQPMLKDSLICSISSTSPSIPRRCDKN